MSDRIEPSRPRSLKGDSTGLSITWSDETRHMIAWRQLRERCPCAVCRVKRAAPPEPAPLLAVIDARDAQPIRATSMAPVGNYAYQIEFSDGHHSGIFSFEFLFTLGRELSSAH